MAEDGNEATWVEKGIEHLNKRIRSSSQSIILLAASIFIPMVNEHFNKEQSMHFPTELSAFFTLFVSVFLRIVLVGECFTPCPGHRRYVAIKLFVHVCTFLLVIISFCLALMMRMNVVVTSLTLAVAAVFVAHRLWQCATTKLKDDLGRYRDIEKMIEQLIELSSSITTTLFLGWFGMAFFYFMHFPEKARDTQILPSEYVTFFTSVAASLTMPKVVPRNLWLDWWPFETPAAELQAAILALVLGLAATALVIAASKVGRYVVLALLPEALVLVVWILPSGWLRYLEYGHRGDEPSSNTFVTAAMTVLLAVLTYHAKGGGLSSLHDEAFVMFTAAAVVAALSWRMVTQLIILDRRGQEVQAEASARPVTPAEASAKILAFFTFLLLLLSVVASFGIMFGW